MGKYKVCECGHRDDWHQTCSPDTVLSEGQLPCYGVNGAGCSCQKWATAIVYGNATANTTIDQAYNLQDVEARLKWKQYPHTVVLVVE